MNRFADLVNVTWETGCRPQESLRVEARHVDLQNQRWVFRKSESKMKRITRVIYLTDTALAITRRLMLAHPEGRLFRNTNGKALDDRKPRTAPFDAVQVRMGKAEMQRRGEEISDEEIAAAVKKLANTRIRNGEQVTKTQAELRCEAKRKLTNKRAAELAPRYSLYALAAQLGDERPATGRRCPDRSDPHGPRRSVDAGEGLSASFAQPGALARRGPAGCRLRKSVRGQLVRVGPVVIARWTGAGTFVCGLVAVRPVL